MPNFNDNLQPLPKDSWFEQQKRKQWIPGDTEQLINERDPYGIYSRIDANLGADAPAELRSDLAGMRATGEAADAKRAPLQAIYEGKAYSMPSKRSTVQQPEAVAALDLVMKNRAIAEQKAKDDALMREAQADRAAKRNREAATVGQEQEARRMALDKQKRMSDAARKMAGPRDGIMGITDRLGITQQDPRITAAAATEDPAQIAAAQQAIRAEEEAKKRTTGDFYGKLAGNPNISPADRARFTGLQAGTMGVTLDPSALTSVSDEAKASMPLEQVLRKAPQIEELIGNIVSKIGKYSDLGDPFSNGGEGADQDQKLIEANANYFANKIGGDPRALAAYIYNEIAARKNTLPKGNALGRAATSLFGLVGDPRSEYVQSLLGGRSTNYQIGK